MANGYPHELNRLQLRRLTTFVENIWGKFGCLRVPASYSLENSIARLRFAAVLRTE
jgi:hypothetical protein